MYEYRRGGSVFGAFLFGGLVGAVLGLLFAPRSGKETREIIAEKAEDYWGEGVDLYNTGVHKAAEVYETGKETASEKTEVLRAKIDEARGRLQEQVAKSAEVAKEKVADVVPAAQTAVEKAAEATKGGIGTAGAKAQETLEFVAKKAAEDKPAEDKPAEPKPADKPVSAPAQSMGEMAPPSINDL